MNVLPTFIVAMWKGAGVPNIGRITVSYFLSKKQVLYCKTPALVPLVL